MLQSALLMHMAMQAFCGTEQSNIMIEQGSKPEHIWTCPHAIVQASPPPVELDDAVELELDDDELDDDDDDELDLAADDVDDAMPPPGPPVVVLTSLPQAAMPTAVHRAMLTRTTYVDFRIAPPPQATPGSRAA